jgi:hypothetical protein
LFESETNSFSLFGNILKYTVNQKRDHQNRKLINLQCIKQPQKKWLCIDPFKGINTKPEIIKFLYFFTAPPIFDK